MNDYAFSDISSDFPPGYVDPDEDLVTTAQIVAQETDDLSKTILGKVFTIDFLLKHILNANLKRRGNLGIVSPDNTFVSNEQFWKGFYIEGQSRAFRWVRLESFQLTDWFPRSPGLSSSLSERA